MKQYQALKYIEKDAVLHIFACGGDQPEALHSHDFLELVYILSGTAKEYVDGAQYDVGRGDLLLIREGEGHSFVGDHEFTYINLCFDPTRLSREGGSPSVGASLLGRVAFDGILERNGGCLVRFSESEREEIERLLSVMRVEYDARRYGWQAVLRHYLDIFFLSVLRALEERGSLAPAEEGIWQSLATYIDSHPTADLSLAALSRRLFYNPSYFSRAFSHHFGLTLSEYVSARRVALCERLAVEAGGAASIAVLAEASGFSSRTALYRAFLRHRGESIGSFIAKVKKRTDKVK